MEYPEELELNYFRMLNLDNRKTEIKIVIYLLLAINTFLLFVSLLITPYKINEGELVVVDEDSIGVVEMFSVVIFILGLMVVALAGKIRSKFFSYVSLIFLAFSVIQFIRMKFYFEKLLD